MKPVLQFDGHTATDKTLKIAETYTGQEGRPFAKVPNLSEIARRYAQYLCLLLF